MTQPAIRVDGLGKTYRRRLRRHETLKGALVGWLRRSRQPDSSSHRALDEVSFEVAHGQTFAVVGANGSGKSTLLKILAGIIPPSQGRFEVDGRVAALLELGAGFHPEISGRENVIINGILLGLERREVERRLPEIVAFAGLEDAIDAPVKSYSSGMYVRLGFAVATAMDPDVLLVDEVLAVGDEEFAHRCIERFEQLKRRNKTIVLVTHSLDLAESLADEACWLHEGRLLAHGYPREVTDAYRALVEQKEQRRLSGEAAALPAPAETEAEPEPPPDPRAPRRWGDGLVRIESVRLLDAEGADSQVLHSGQAASLELEVVTSRPVEDFVIGVAVYSEQGVCVYGSNTELDGWRPERLEGRARVAIEFPALELIEGRYTLDVAVHRKTGAAYDYRLAVLALRVSSERADVGLVRLPHRWSFSGEVRIEPPRER